MTNQELQLGLVVRLEDGPEEAIRSVRESGLDTCHLSNYDPSLYNPEVRERLEQATSEHGVRISGLWAGWPGHVVWDFVDGPATIGLVPLDLREERAEFIKQGADFARELGIPLVITHLGFIPEDLSDELYTSLIPVLRSIAEHCAKLGQQFCFETGQETPVTLLRTIHDIGLDNVGVNLDPANLLLYGKGNPEDAVDVLGPYIRGVHIKDGEYPTEGRSLGKERPVGEGRVDFPTLLSKLRGHGYRNDLCIECELEGVDQAHAIRSAKAKLEGWIREL